MELDFLISLMIYLCIVTIAMAIDSKVRISGENIVIIISTLVFIFLLYQVCYGEIIKFDLASNFGKTIGGVLAFFSIVLLYISIKRQSRSFFIGQFENMFFEQIKYHRLNVKAFRYQIPSSKKKKIVRGNKVFLYIHRKIEYAAQIVTGILKANEFEKIYKSPTPERLKLNGRNFSIEQVAIFDISYLIVFFGVNKEGIAVLKTILKQIYVDDVIDYILNVFETKPVKYSSLSELNPLFHKYMKDKSFTKYFGGHQHRLGHYYRHFYQSVKFVDSENDLNFDYKIKYRYLKRYRAQLSTYEQSVFFYNSISQLGRVWELEHTNINFHLITKYNMIKNIPINFLSDINLIDIYPNVAYETSEIPDGRSNLVKKYK